MKLDELSPSSRVWIYLANRKFTSQEVLEINQKIQLFCSQWTAHNQQLKAAGEVKYNCFIVLSVDESLTGASGCSIDKSVKIIEQLSSEYNVELFDRMLFAYEVGGEVVLSPREDFSSKYVSGEINDDTIVFDNLVPNIETMNSSWKKKLGESWHARMV